MGADQHIRTGTSPLRAIIRGMDFIACKLEGIHEFDNSDDCLLRFSYRRNKAAVHLYDGTTIPQGAAVIELHLWNSRLAIPRDGLDLRRGASGQRQLRRSLARLALYLAAEPSMRDIEATLIAPAFTRSRAQKYLRQLPRLLGGGWTPVSRPLNVLERLHEIADSAWLWLLLWAFNPRGKASRHFLRHRQEFWLSRQAFLALYLPKDAGQVPVATTAPSLQVSR